MVETNIYVNPIIGLQHDLSGFLFYLLHLLNYIIYKNNNTNKNSLQRFYISNIITSTQHIIHHMLYITSLQQFLKVCSSFYNM